MNSVTLTGRLTKDPELTEREGTTICDLRVAENGRNGQVTYVDVAAFGRQAEVSKEHLSKGRLIGVSGSLRYSEWQAEDGSKRSKHSVVANRVEFLDGPRDGEAATEDSESAAA